MVDETVLMEVLEILKGEAADTRARAVSALTARRAVIGRASAVAGVSNSCWASKERQCTVHNVLIRCYGILMLTPL
jgi:hypothetical protein